MMTETQVRCRAEDTVCNSGSSPVEGAHAGDLIV